MLGPIEIKAAFFYRLPFVMGKAICLFPFIFYRAAEPSKCSRVHEHYHWHQALRCGVIPFYLVYIAFMPFHGTRRSHPLEKPAYEAQKRCEEEP